MSTGEPSARYGMSSIGRMREMTAKNEVDLIFFNGDVLYYDGSEHFFDLAMPRRARERA